MFEKLRVTIAVVFMVAGLRFATEEALSQDATEVSAAVKTGIENEQDFKTVFDFVRSSDSEEKWREIGWIPSLWTGLKMAEEKQKPIFVWAMNGDPLGCV